MNEHDDSRIWEGVRAHLDELGSSIPIPRLGELLGSRSQHRRSAAAFAGLAGVIVLVAFVGTVLVIPRFAAGPSVAPSPVTALTTDGPFSLRIQSDKVVYSTDEPVGVSATLTYNGPGASVVVSHGFGGPMSIGVVEPVNGVSMGTGWRLSCDSSILQRGVPVSQLFHKSGSTPDGMSVPSFLAFIADPRMPAGTWHFYVEALFYEGANCSDGGVKHDIQSEIAVQVSPGSGSTPSPSIPSEATAPPAAASPGPTTVPACSPNPTETGTALAGVVELRPDGWAMLTNGSGLAGFPDVQWQVYGPEGAAVPPTEGPSRLALYETFSGSDAYFTSRVDASRTAGGNSVALTVCGDSTEAWTNPSTGELVLGWTYRGKSDVLVANTADYTVQQLVESAERVYDCCG